MKYSLQQQFVTITEDKTDEDVSPVLSVPKTNLSSEPQSNKQQSDEPQSDQPQQDELQRESRPRLQNHHAYHPQSLLKAKKVVVINNIDNDGNDNNDEYVSDYSILEKYASYPYIKYGKSVINGYIKEIGASLNVNNNIFDIIPQDILNLCCKYSYCHQDGIFQFGYFVSKIVEKITKKRLSFALGFTGIELMKNIRKYIKGFNEMNENDLLKICNDLIKYKYIRPIATNYVFGGIFDSILCNNTKYLYECNQTKLNLFKAFDKFHVIYDKLAWTVGTNIEIYSHSIGGWNNATISNINNKKVTVLFNENVNNENGNNENGVRRKTIDRFNNNKVRSTNKFINNRKYWTINDRVQIYSHSKHQWLSGKIKDILIKDKNKSYIEQMIIVYDSNNKKCSKLLSRWSPDLRDINITQQIPLSLKKYTSGTKVKIYSKSKQKWIDGHIKVLIESIHCVLVKYGKSEKIVNINSNQLNL